MEQRVLGHLQTNCQSLTPHQQAELERLEYGSMCSDFYKDLEKKKIKIEKDVKEEPDSIENYFVKKEGERNVDYAMELSSIKGRRLPGICCPTEFSHLITATELIK
jgi:hypothetical protein